VSPRVAIIDSGVHASHPHVGGVASGLGFDAGGARLSDHVDRLGHGTAVTAVIREKAPRAEIHVVRIFRETLRTEIAALLAALDWCLEARVPLVNLSLGTTEAAHEEALVVRVNRAIEAGVLVVSAFRDPARVSYLPGRLAGVLGVEVDEGCPREVVRPARGPDGSFVCRASPLPRPIPGVPPERNLRGMSFAVANVTGCLARLLEDDGPLYLESAARRLELAYPLGS